jgi:hypothetical protein
MRILFKGRAYILLQESHAGFLIIYEALRLGIMDHVGSLSGNLPLKMSTPQVYEWQGFLYAAAVQESNFINRIWAMKEAA